MALKQDEFRKQSKSINDLEEVVEDKKANIRWIRFVFGFLILCAVIAGSMAISSGFAPGGIGLYVLAFLLLVVELIAEDNVKNGPS